MISDFLIFYTVKKRSRLPALGHVTIQIRESDMSLKSAFACFSLQISRIRHGVDGVEFSSSSGIVSSHVSYLSKTHGGYCALLS